MLCCCRAPLVYTGDPYASLARLREDVSTHYRGLCHALGEPERSDLLHPTSHGASYLPLPGSMGMGNLPPPSGFEPPHGSSSLLGLGDAISSKIVSSNSSSLGTYWGQGAGGFGGGVHSGYGQGALYVGGASGVQLRQGGMLGLGYGAAAAGGGMYPRAEMPGGMRSSAVTYTRNVPQVGVGHTGNSAQQAQCTPFFRRAGKPISSILLITHAVTARTYNIT